MYCFIHTDVHFLYYTSEYNAYLFQPFIISKEDHLIKTLQIDDIITYFNTGNYSNINIYDVINIHINVLLVSWLLRPLPNINANTENYKSQMENYVAPSQSILYKLHSHWRKNTKKTTVTVCIFTFYLFIYFF